MDTLLLDSQCGCKSCPLLSVKLWNYSLPQQKKWHHHCEKHILRWSIFLVFINSTLSPTNTICHSPEDLKCRLKLHIGIKSIKQHTRYHCLDQKTLCCPQIRALFKLSLVAFFLRDSVFRAADASASYPSAAEALLAFSWCFSPMSGAWTGKTQGSPILLHQRL